MPRVRIPLDGLSQRPANSWVHLTLRDYLSLSFRDVKSAIDIVNLATLQYYVPVSYTHLDVYKRQVLYELVKNIFYFYFLVITFLVSLFVRFVMRKRL